MRKKKDRKKPQKTIQSYLSYGDFVAAGALYLQQNNQTETADLYFQMPPEKRPAYETMIVQKLGQQGAQFFWIKTGRRLERIAPEKARIAFLLAGAYFDAVKMYVDSDDAQRAAEIISNIPVNLQEGTVRRLSQYAFNRGKFPIAAELLRSIGFVDEADAILAVGAHDYVAIERPQVAADLYDEVGRQDLVGASQERQGEIALSEGRIEAAKTAFEKAIQAYDDSSKPKDALRVEDRLKKFELLEQFREYAASGDVDAAEDMIDEINNSFPGIAISDLYAEIASVLEKSNRTSEAITYFDKAADSTNNPVKRQSYVNALRRIGTNIASQRSKGEAIATSDFTEKCIVCKLPIKKGERFVTCPNCKKPSHYSHFIEYLKVQGSCPNCFTKLKVDDIKDD
ncbi:MAG: hypothetical protein EAX90_01545 [Candidatus Heimdallarchaeota archaeon]|nr:hypothetical protein [Candidatus Heimdallarchaeota archaeon]